MSRIDRPSMRAAYFRRGSPASRQDEFILDHTRSLLSRDLRAHNPVASASRGQNPRKTFSTVGSRRISCTAARPMGRAVLKRELGATCGRANQFTGTLTPLPRPEPCSEPPRVGCCRVKHPRISLIYVRHFQAMLHICRSPYRSDRCSHTFRWMGFAATA
jgi:hypothetical protein